MATKIFKIAFNYFTSLRTALWLILALLFLLLYGSVVMPLEPEFQSMQAVSLFDWLSQNRPAITWWLWGAIAVLSFLTANTLICSIESILRKRAARQWLLIISPQVIHTGFLFVLLAHLLSSYGGFKGTAVVYKGSALYLGDAGSAVFDSIEASVGPYGYIEDWSVAVRFFSDGREIAHSVIRPNRPSFQNGLGLYVKTVQTDPFPAALIEVSREPGAAWALAGGILFIVGMTALLILKAGREEALSE